MLKYFLTTVTSLENLPATQPDITTTPSFLRMGLSFAGLIVALFLVIWVLKKLAKSKLGFFGNDALVKIIERKALSPKTILYVVEFKNQKILISESSQHVKMKDLSDLSVED